MLEASTTAETPLTPVTSPVNDEPAMDAGEKSMGDVYDRLMSDGVTDEGGEQSSSDPTRDAQGRFVKSEAEGSKVAEASPQTPGEDAGDQTPGHSDRAPQTTLPANLPPDMADTWNAIPEEHRDRMGQFLHGIHQKMSDQGRALSGFKDVQTVIDDMTQTYAHRFQGEGAMRPAEAISFLYNVQKSMDMDPRGTFREIAARYNLPIQFADENPGEGGSNVQIAQLQNTIAELNAKISQLGSPDTINSQVTRAMSERETLQAVERFAKEKPFYSDVEAHLPQFIGIARETKPDASELDLLTEAYEMAVNAIPAVRQKAQAAAAKPAAPKPEDKRAAAAARASSINVTSASSGKARPKTESESMGEAYDRLMRA